MEHQASEVDGLGKARHRSRREMRISQVKRIKQTGRGRARERGKGTLHSRRAKKRRKKEEEDERQRERERLQCLWGEGRTKERERVFVRWPCLRSSSGQDQPRCLSHTRLTHRGLSPWMHAAGKPTAHVSSADTCA